MCQWKEKNVTLVDTVTIVPQERSKNSLVTPLLASATLLVLPGSWWVSVLMLTWVKVCIGGADTGRKIFSALASTGQSSERTVVIIPKGEAFANGRDILTSYVGERKTSWWIVTGPILSEEKQCARLDQFHLPFENISEGWHPNVASFNLHSGKINLGVVRRNFNWGYFCTKWMMKKLGLEKNSKEIDVKMVKKPPSVDNPTIIKLYFFNGITWKGIANQPAAFV